MLEKFNAVKNHLPPREAHLYGIGLRVVGKDSYEIIEVYLNELLRVTENYTEFRAKQGELFWKANKDTPLGRELERRRRRILALWQKRVKIKIKYMGKVMKV